MRALWIEMSPREPADYHHRSRPVRALWIEISERLSTCYVELSRPVRALWIEILTAGIIMAASWVEAREGLVD